MILFPWRPYVGPEQWLGSRLYTLQCWEMRMGNLHPDGSSQMSCHKSHHISALTGQVEVCGILPSPQISYILYPTLNLGGKLRLWPKEGGFSILTPTITTWLPIYTQWVSTTQEFSSPLLSSMGFPEQKVSPPHIRARQRQWWPLKIFLRFDCVLIFEKVWEFMCECMCIVHNLVELFTYILYCLNLVWVLRLVLVSDII